MDSLFEKITLYDILGYMLPGGFFIILLLIPLEIKELEAGIELMGKTGTLFVVAVLIIAYVCGIVLSEMARWMFGLWMKIWKKVTGEAAGLSGKVEKEKIILALKESKLVKEDNLLPTLDEKEIKKKYYRVMNAAVQIDGKYKRIHNYASAVVLYKNLACAVIASLAVRYVIWHKAWIWYDIGCVGVAICFFVRLVRFEQKVQEYTEVFFVDKYLGKEGE